MLALLTGSGLAASSGLNAYIPLLTLGLLSRYTDTVTLPAGWQWLDGGWALLVLAALLAIETVADKIPVIDSANDVLQTVVRPTAGGLAFGATSTSDAVTVNDPGSFFAHGQWVPVAIGVVLALVVHAGKATARPVINTATVGFGAPIVSTLEDAASLGLSLIALLAPILVVVGLLGLATLFWWSIRKIKARRRRRQAAAAPTAETVG